MRKKILLLFLVTSLPLVVLAQDFELIIHDSTKNGDPGTEIVCDGKIFNLTTAAITVLMIRATEMLPEGWFTSLCFNFCAAPFVDTLETNIAVGDSQEFSIHFNTTMTPATGSSRLLFTNPRGTTAERHLFTGSTEPGSVESPDQVILQNCTLLQNYPNPFNNRTIITATIAIGQTVTLEIFNPTGAKIYHESRNNVNELVRFSWPGINNAGMFVPTGVYFYRMKIQHINSFAYTDTKTLTLVR